MAGNVLNSKEFQKLNMKDPETKKLVSEKSGIPLSQFNNPNEVELRRTYQWAAIEIGKKNKKESSSKSSLEKEESKTYNKSNRVK